MKQKKNLNFFDPQEPICSKRNCRIKNVSFFYGLNLEELVFTVVLLQVLVVFSLKT